MPPSLSQITIVGPNDPAVLTWPITSRMGDGAWYHTNNEGTVDCPHSKAGKWPVFYLTPDQPDPTAAEGNLWGICEYDGQWYARTLHYLRPGQVQKSKPRREWAEERIPPGLGPIPPTWEGPVPGALLGMFVSTRARYGLSQTQERSDIVWVKYGSPGIVAREGETPTPPDPPDPPNPPDPPSPPEPPAWVIRIEERLDTMNSLLAQIVSMFPDLLDTALEVRKEVQKGIKLRLK